MTKKDRAMSRIDTPSKTGDNQPLTAVARALPADPSRADPMVSIHHHGSEARTVVTVASPLRISCCMVVLPVGQAFQPDSSRVCQAGKPDLHQTVGSMALALLLCRGSN